MPHRAGPFWVKLLIVLAVVGFAGHLLQEIDWSQLGRRLQAARPAAVAMALGGLLCRTPLLSARWMLCLKTLHRSFSALFVLMAQSAAILVNHVTPTARLLGGLFRARHLQRRYSISFGDAFGTVLLDQISHQIVQGLLVWLALAGLASAVGAQPLAVALLTALAILILAGGRGWRRRRALLESPPLRWLQNVAARRTRRIGLLETSIGRVREILRQGLTNRGLQLRLAALGIALAAINAGSQWLLFAAIDHPVRYLPVLMVVVVGNAAGIVTGTPGGVAVTEVAMIAGYMAVGVPEVEAASATLLYRGLHYLVVLAQGLPALLYCELRGARSARAAGRRAATAARDEATPERGSRSDPDG